MKKRRGANTLILFRNGDNFEAYDIDAEIISKALQMDTFIEDELVTICFQASSIDEYTNNLLNAGYAICISEMRDETGSFIPNMTITDE